MANEAILVFETSPAIPMTCADGTGIEKGAALKVADPFTVSAAGSAEDYCGGFAKREKVASNGETTIPVFRGGIFLVTTAAAVTAGQTGTISATANKFQACDATCIGSKVWGIFLETASGADETVLFELRPGANTNAYA